MKIKVLTDIPGYKAGEIVDVETDKSGTPVLMFWRKRLKDAEHDKCVCIHTTKKKAVKSSD